MCKYCNNSESRFNSFCVSCNEGVKSACFNCFTQWHNKHPTRPYNVSVNKWNGRSHLVDNCTAEYLEELEAKPRNKILEVI